MTGIIEQEARKITKVYKIAYKDVLNRIQNKLSKYPTVLSLIEASDSHKIGKNKEFKSAVKAVKKEIYYDLRQYRQKNGSENTQRTIEELDKALENNDLEKIINLFSEAVKGHISTKERTENIQHFHSQFEDLIKESKIIMDVGGGLYPLTFPFENALKLNKYIWIDIDTKSFEILSRFKKFFSQSKIELFNESFENRKWTEYCKQAPDLVLMLKLVPVIWRQQRGLVEKLAKAPGKILLVTANKEAMTKNESVVKRENAIVHKFIKLSGREIIREIDTQDEFGYLLA